MKYAVSPNVSSKFVFVFSDYVCDLEEQDYNNVLLIERNNEVPLYTNAYLNYLRTGFNFDTKQAQRKNAMNWASVGLQTVGAVASFISSAYSGAFGVAQGISLLTSATSKIMSNIESAKANDEAIKNKMLQASMQSESVSGNDDITLFKYYTPNKAKLVYYECSENMKQTIYDLFWYFGYACNNSLASEKDNGNDIWSLTHSRKYFNYIEGDFVIRVQDIDKTIREKIQECYKNGVTFIHDLNTTEGAYPVWYEPSYLYGQDIENIENTFTLS